MEWQNQQQQQNQTEQLQMQMQVEQLSNAADGVGGLYVKVMTDEQMELLRQQISVYASICDQLVEMHKAITAQQDLAGLSLFFSLFLSSCITLLIHSLFLLHSFGPTKTILSVRSTCCSCRVRISLGLRNYPPLFCSVG